MRDNPLPQYEMIARLRRVCAEDERLVAAMLYGSFARREGDEYSDLDVMLFFQDEHLTKIDAPSWLEQIAPVEIYYRNEFGNHAVIFANLVRGEFHFDSASQMANLAGFQGQVWFPNLQDATLVDKSGDLAQHLHALIGEPPAHDSAQDADYVCRSFLNWFLFGANAVGRGEYARARAIMGMFQDNLLRMARILEGCSREWILPYRRLETELSPQAYERYQACTSGAESVALATAYRLSWEWGRELIWQLAASCDLQLPETLIKNMEARCSLLLSDHR
jgi:lincosamide nucleotidyltransferase